MRRTFLKSASAIRLFALLFLFLSCACNNSKSERDTNQQTQTKEDNSELKVGGLYLKKDKDGNYSVAKILAIDEFAVHLRIYSNKFRIKPTQLNSSDLEVLIGHSPLDKQAFLNSDHELIKVEDVKDSELEGYKLYLEAMKKEN